MIFDGFTLLRGIISDDLELVYHSGSQFLSKNEVQRPSSIQVMYTLFLTEKVSPWAG